MHGVGLDLLDIARLERALERRPALAARLFSDGELAYADRHVRPAQQLAARFCAKEAVTKALGLEVLRPRDVEVVRDHAGRPSVRLHGAAQRRAHELGATVLLTLTHTATTAGAVAVAT
jgi:holo-[acyl-carrier protein] synthase